MLRSERTYVCSDCGLVIDRDFNAALNLKQLPKAIPEDTPVDIEALVSLFDNETSVDEAGTFNCEHLCAQ